MSVLDLNADVGEGEPRARTAALMRHVGSVNVACGGHAGTMESMEYCAAVALREGVRLGAHPGIQTGGSMGRGVLSIVPEALELLVVQQVMSLVRVAGRVGGRVRHLKLHGALYHAAEDDGRLAECFVRCVKRWLGGLRIIARSGGLVAPAARRAGLPVWEEIFADRGYTADGGLVARGLPGAMLTDGRRVRERLEEWSAGRGICSVTGEWVCLRADTICVHADTEGAVRLARLVRKWLEGKRGGLSGGVRG